MFTNTEAFSGFSVDDLEAAKKFYGETLGVRTSEQYGLLTLHLAGGRDTLVYPKPGHVPAPALSIPSHRSPRPPAIPPTTRPSPSSLPPFAPVTPGASLSAKAEPGRCDIDPVITGSMSHHAHSGFAPSVPLRPISHARIPRACPWVRQSASQPCQRAIHPICPSGL
jgi:catechol 2,3-dioxygenase-like lactoylglutathione lyase family enzyme